ncbi:protein POLAR-like 1 isoform X1 [Zingiber officinale]|uniref:Protein POLAR LOCALIZATION DURING ASYMMETRIC DIVISION AND REDISTRIBUTION n=1 Tax=Zingiber officinale TaxID=94328 RepID=A0A8J5LM45_ZINOF|nr:protein POLAR-like 1 isoform X1 [Zingiber officinale]KAG6521339.1 hypothetical protein ZIOFF_018454 [Zingiber officinale]
MTMTFSLKQGNVLCFCVAPGEGGGEVPVAEEMRVSDCLEESLDREMEAVRRAKRRELCLRLPPSSSATSAAASTTAASFEAFSPRSLISRVLLPLLRPSQARNAATEGGEQVVGCRVWLPRLSAGNRKETEKREAPPAAVAILETAIEAAGSRPEIAVNSGKINDERSLNLGMGVGLVYLLARSAAEMNKMVELRQEMEILLKDIKDELQSRDFPSNNSAESSNHASSVTNVKKSDCQISQDDEESFNSIREEDEALRRAEAEEEEKYERNRRVRRCLKMDEMEMELQEQLERLQWSFDGKASMELLLENHPQACESLTANYAAASSSQFGVSPHELTIKLNQLLQARRQEGISELESSFLSSSNNFSGSSGELGFNGELMVEQTCSGSDCGVCAIELERRLHEVLEARQRERIVELESALRCAERRLRDKEREICWWRDTARLVAEHKKEVVSR